MNEDNKELTQNEMNKEEVASNNTLHKKNMSKAPIIIAIIFAVLLTAITSITIKTTLVASIVACMQENADNKLKYITFEMLPTGKGFSEYKEDVIYSIRVDKAAGVREQQMKERKALVSVVSIDCANLIKDAFSFEKEMKKEAETSEDQQKFEQNLKMPAISEKEQNVYERLLNDIATSVHFAMASDAYYIEFSQEEVANLMNSFMDKIDKSNFEDDFYIEQLAPGEYDPIPERNLAYKYEEALNCCKNVYKNEEFDYIISDRVMFKDETGKFIVEVESIFVASPQSYAMLLTDVKIANEYLGLLPEGKVSYYSNESEWTANSVPMIISEEEMRRKADAMAMGFKNSLTLNGTAGELSELYNALFEKMSETKTQEDSAENVDSTLLDEESKKVFEETANIIKEVKESLISQFDVETEWGNIVFLEGYIYIAQQLINENAQDKAMCNHPELLSKEMSEDEKNQIYSIIGLKENILLNMPDPEFVCEEDVELDITSFESVYPAQTGNDLPLILVKKVFTYNFNGIGTFKVYEILTQKGVFVTNVEWTAVSEENETAILQSTTQDLYSIPNLPRMEKEAAEAINREDYEDEVAYNTAINRWLYNNYPDYYENPDQSGSAGTGTVSLYYNNAFDKFIKDTRSSLGWAYQDWGYITEGTLFGYLFTPNGGYRSFADDVSDVAKEAVQVFEDVGDAVKDWWRDLWW